MFDTLTKRLSSVFDSLRSKGSLSEADVTSALREIRIALLEADVALPSVKAFIDEVRPLAVGQDVIKSITPGQMVIKIVYDHLIKLLGEETVPLNFQAKPPVVFLMVGLQGSGKTTSSAKLARFLKEKMGKRVLLASLDVYRPAAQKQLEVLANQISVQSLPIVEGQKPRDITKRSFEFSKLQSIDVIILDTAGRLHIDEELMQEIKDIQQLSTPTETLLVADAMTGQDAVTMAKAFHDAVHLTGVILTRVDGDARGGAALSIRHITQCPIKFMGVGEKIDQFQAFDPKRIADRILDRGDIVSLVEKAATSIDQDEAEAMALKMQKGTFNLNDLAKYLQQMLKMGGISSLIGFLPGMGKIKDQLNDIKGKDQIIHRQIGIIRSMTPKERANPKILNGSRRKRIASGAGVEVSDVNKLLKQFEQLATVMKKMKQMSGKGFLRGGLGNLLGPRHN